MRKATILGHELHRKFDEWAQSTHGCYRQLEMGTQEFKFNLRSLGRIRNKWITEGMSELLSTFVLSVSYSYIVNQQNHTILITK